MTNIITSTNARKHFFELLNRVLYGDEDIYITKSGTSSMVKLEKVDSGKSVLDKLAGSISNEDAEKMKKEIHKAKTRKSRDIDDFA